ncbi:MAG: hypothetical protein AMK69_20970 [Nitrospira bacterium SG8_3]|nr:MAG: hypothetical protein AMK69_20970 [Nitrospira bacterium SG8_3]
MKNATLSLCMIFAMTLLTGEAHLVFAESDMGQPSDSEQEAGPVEFEQIVEFEQDVHFLNPDGTDVVLPAGGYYVDPVQNGLRLKSADKEEAEAVIVQAEVTTHDQSVEASEVVSIKEGEDQQVLMVLLPDGKAMQAVGSSSGIQARGFVKAFKLGPGVLQYLPKVIGIFTTPKLGALTPGGILYVKGEHLGTSKGKINLHLSHPVPQVVSLSIEEWNDIKIKAKIPSSISGVIDHQAKFQVMSAKGVGGIAWKVQFYAARASKQLKSNDPAVKVTHCSTGGDRNYCNGLNTSTGGSCFSAGIPPVFKTGTIYAQHVNCDGAIDWDDGKDRYEVALKNGWVFKKVEYTNKKSSGSEKISAPDYAKLRRDLPGTTSWKPEIGWEVSPGPDQLEYVYWLTIEGPKGVPHY